jgi:hypothetical protein
VVNKVNITLFRESVLDILKKNKELHIIEYEKQIAGWKIKMEEYNEEMMAWVGSGGTNKRPNEPYKPYNYLETYEKNIKMVSSHVEPKLIFNESEFEEMINDEFHWKRSFNTTSSVYNTI